VLLVDPALVVVTSFFCAQAPRLNALAAMARIITAFKIFMELFAPFPSKLLRSFRQVASLAQRFSEAFFLRLRFVSGR